MVVRAVPVRLLSQCSAGIGNVRAKLETLELTLGWSILSPDTFTALTVKLPAVNEELWNITDEIQDFERANRRLRPDIVELTRSVPAALRTGNRLASRP